LLTRLAAALRLGGRIERLEYLTTVHPCFVDGTRTLVHKRGLASGQPGVFQRLKAYALRHGFALLEERRRRELECRDERRRLAPVLLFAAGGLVAHATFATDGTLEVEGETVIPTIEVIGTPAAVDERPYLIEAGKRFVSQPHGEVELILGVAEQVRLNGNLQRVRTRGLQMPSEYVDTFVDRYDYTMPESCGGGSFSYYEGDGFAALGYHADKGKVVLDVLAGGGPYSAPRLWGTYDQVLNSNVRMDLMFGSGLEDGMGVLKASYKIGLMPVLRTSTKNYYGELYARQVALAAACQGPALPIVRQADTIAPQGVEDAS
jgi:hypothetical protein